MKAGLLGVLGGVILLISAQGSAETLPEYVTACKNELGFTDIPAMNCNDGVRFGINPSGGFLNDVLVYKRLSNYTDLAAACRWLNLADQDVPAQHGDQPPFHATTAASVEMLIHNRQSGKSCFFAAKSSNGSLLNGVSVSIVPPTSANASAYWMSPLDLLVPPNPQTSGSTLRCVSCHAAGPYIASPRIAPYLAQFGLLNNGHDTISGAGTGSYQAVNSNVAGSFFSGINNPLPLFGGPPLYPSWNFTISDTLGANPCSAGCHSVGLKSTTPAVLGNNGQVLIPSLGPSFPTGDINLVLLANVMPQNTTARLGDDYRWNNVDIPDDPNSTGDAELFYDLKANWVGFTPRLNSALTCETEPAYMEAHQVGSTLTRKSNEYIASTTGFGDVLEKFDQTGLICRNASQPSGMCGNYVVRYVCLKDQLSVYSRWTGRALTIANPDANWVRLAKGQPYNTTWGPQSQTWHVEGLNDGTTNYNYMRFRNDYFGLYLNADDSLLVTNAPKTDSWTSEQWVMENYNGTHFVRFRNLWKTNMYLTMVDSSDYSPVNLQPLHVDGNGQPDWLSQQWELK